MHFIQTYYYIFIDPENVTPLITRKQPRNIKDYNNSLESFLVIIIDDLCLIFQKYYDLFYDLLKKDKPFVWGKDEENAFLKLISSLTTYPILRQPDFKQTFYLYTDASGYALRAVLGQRDEDKRECVIAYASRLLIGAELQYGLTEKECLAVILVIMYFRVYVFGCHFKINTDHSALTWLMKL